MKGEYMIPKREIRRSVIVIICFSIIALAGCKGGSEKVTQPDKEMTSGNAMSPADVKSIPAVVLTGAKIQEDPDASAVRVEIMASGLFGSNVVPKTDPERIIIVLHNATKGDMPPNIKVNKGTINHLEIAELNTGKGTAVRITIFLDHKSDYRVTPADNGLLIDVRKRT